MHGIFNILQVLQIVFIVILVHKNDEILFIDSVQIVSSSCIKHIIGYTDTFVEIIVHLIERNVLLSHFRADS